MKNKVFIYFLLILSTNIYAIDNKDSLELPPISPPEIHLPSKKLDLIEQTTSGAKQEANLEKTKEDLSLPELPDMPNLEEKSDSLNKEALVLPVPQDTKNLDDLNKKTSPIESEQGKERKITNKDIETKPNNKINEDKVRNSKRGEQERFNKNIPDVRSDNKSEPREKVSNREWEDESKRAIEERFVENEILMLFTEEDEVVLGVLTEEAMLDMMPISIYIEKFWQAFEEAKKFERSTGIRNFVKNYNHWQEPSNMLAYLELEGKGLDNLSQEKVKELTFQAVEHSDIDTLRALFNKYNNLQTLDNNDNNLLVYAIIAKDEEVAEFLIKRGINLKQKNCLGKTPLEIAEQMEEKNIFDLIQSAGLRKNK